MADLTITRTGDVITIFPARGDLRQAVALLRQMPKPVALDPCEPIEPPGRGWD